MPGGLIVPPRHFIASIITQSGETICSYANDDDVVEGEEGGKCRRRWVG